MKIKTYKCDQCGNVIEKPKYEIAIDRLFANGEDKEKKISIFLFDHAPEMANIDLCGDECLFVKLSYLIPETIK
jgi:hypothetical protein